MILRKLFTILITSLLVFAVSSTSLLAEDIEIYAASPKANVLFVIDVSGSMNEIVSGSTKRLDVLKSAFSSVLSRNWNNLNVGIMDFGDNRGSGVDFPVADINQPAHQVETSLSISSTETYADLLIRAVNAYQPRHSNARTPTVEGLYEAALLFRGDEAYAGDHPDVDPHTYWNNGSSKYDGGHWASAGLRTHTGTINPNGQGDWCQNGPDFPGAWYNPCGGQPKHNGTCQNYSQGVCNGSYSCRRYDSTGECVSYQCNGGFTNYTRQRCRLKEPRWDNADYISPITNECDQNYIVLLSDGGPTEDSGTVQNRIEDLYDPDLSDCGDLDSDFSITINDNTIEDKGECGPDLTGYLYNNDQIGGIPGSIVTTHTVGFALSGAELQAKKYLELLAAEGGGNFYNASTDPGNLAQQLEDLLASLDSKPRTISTPITTIDLGSPLSTRKEIYYTQFAARNSPRWNGNVKGYTLGPKTSAPTDPTIAIRDLDEEIATDANGNFLDTSRSYWTGADDGDDVTAGGFAAKLNPSSRTLYTDNGNPSGRSLITLGSNTFDENDLALFNLISTGSASGDNNMIDEHVDWARGVDVDDEDSDGSTTDARAAAGDPLHTVPLVAQYSSGPARVLYTMTNEGYIHAIDVSTNNTSGTGGDEIFAYMPSDLMINLAPLRANTINNPKIYGLDGPLTLFQVGGVLNSAGDKYLYFGMRRGGKNYYSLDVSNSSSPSLRWVIEGGTGVFAELAQTWSKPTTAKVKINSTTEKDVIIFGGGYDEDQDNNAQRADDDEGRAVFIVDAATGAKIWSAGPAGDTSHNLQLGLKNSIPGGIAVVDLDADGIHDRLYFGDTGGRLWRVDLDETIVNSTGYKLADLAEDGSNANNRRFYTEPSVTRLSNGKLGITIGSGYRSHPLNGVVSERTYMIYDPYAAKGNIPSTAPAPKIDGTGSNAVEDITSNFAFNPNAPSANSNGWKIVWPTGNKVMADIDVIEGELHFSVYEPPTSTSSCAGNIGRSAQIVLDVNGRPIGQPDSFYTNPTNTVWESANMVDNILWGGVNLYSTGYSIGQIEGGTNTPPAPGGPLQTRFWLNLDTLMP